MNYEEIIAIHIALHNGEPWVRYGDGIAHITQVDKPGKRYNVCTVYKYEMRTQNTRKMGSPNTAWVLQDPEHRFLTWIMFRGGGYAGKVEQEGGHIKIYMLNPERVVHEEDVDATRTPRV